MKNKGIFIKTALGLLLISLSACDNPFSASSFDLADAMTQALKTPVFIWADPANYCVNQQLQSFKNEVSKASSKELDRLEIWAKNYRAIILEESIAAPKLIGEKVQIELKHKNFWTWIGTASESIEIKTVADNRRTEDGSPWPGTQITSIDTDLYISPIHSIDETLTLIFTTEDETLFNAALTPEDLKERVKAGQISVRSIPSTGLNCGNMASLIEQTK